MRTPDRSSGKIVKEVRPKDDIRVFIKDEDGERHYLKDAQKVFWRICKRFPPRTPSESSARIRTVSELLKGHQKVFGKNEDFCRFRFFSFGKKSSATGRGWCVVL